MSERCCATCTKRDVALQNFEKLRVCAQCAEVLRDRRARGIPVYAHEAPR